MLQQGLDAIYDAGDFVIILFLSIVFYQPIVFADGMGK